MEGIGIERSPRVVAIVIAIAHRVSRTVLERNSRIAIQVATRCPSAALSVRCIRSHGLRQLYLPNRK